MIKEKKKIVVMGGSFNPPTLAHHRLMKAAVDGLEAELGFFVPVSDAYLKRKMRHSHPPVVLSPELRVEMLVTMCADDARMRVCTKDLGTVEARTMPTLEAIQADYPDADVFFVMGADKQSLLSHLTELHGFMEKFGVVLFAREDAKIATTLRNDDVLAPYIGSIVLLPQPAGTENISSSLVRQRMLCGESSEELLSPGVWELFRGFGAADFPDVVHSFKGDYAFLANRFPCQFTWQGLSYKSVEAAFQASKCTDNADRKYYASCSADRAALKGREQTPYDGWEERQLDIMASIQEAKFVQNATLMERLLATGNTVLLNGNNRRETFWGMDLNSWTGENHLGRIIMNVRQKETTK